MAVVCSFGVVLVACIVANLQIVQSKKLVVTSLLVHPFLLANLDTNGTKKVSYEGYIPDLLNELAKLTRTEYALYPRADSKFGHLLPNGSWDGLIGDIVEGRADIAAGPLTETSSRSEIVDFSTPFMNFGPVIILKRPQAPVMTLAERLQRLFAPLSQSIWMMSGLAWLITSAVLYIICYIDPYDWRRLAKDRQATFREGESFSCLNTFWFTMSNILWQGYTRSPRSLGGRVVATFWWLYVLIFVVMYIASMTNYLRVGPMQSVSDLYTNIQSIEDLSQQRLVSFGVIQAGATEQYLKSARVYRGPSSGCAMAGFIYVSLTTTGITSIPHLVNQAATKTARFQEGLLGSRDLDFNDSNEGSRRCNFSWKDTGCYQMLLLLSVYNGQDCKICSAFMGAVPQIPKIKQVGTLISKRKWYVQTLEEAIAKVRLSKKPFAFIAESAMAKYFTRQSPCDIYMVGDFITIGSYSLAFPANSSLVKEMDIALLTLREKGVLKELEDRWFSGECTGYVVESNNNRKNIAPFYGVDLGTFSGALIILGIGLIIGSLATVIEVFVFKYAELQGEKEKGESGRSLTAATAATKDHAESPNSEQEPITDV